MARREAWSCHSADPGSLAMAARKASKPYMDLPPSRRWQSSTNRGLRMQERLVRQHPDQLLVGLVSVSDRASSGAYQDQGIPALQGWLDGALTRAPQYASRVIPDESAGISATLI